MDRLIEQNIKQAQISHDNSAEANLHDAMLVEEEITVQCSHESLAYEFTIYQAQYRSSTNLFLLTPQCSMISMHSLPDHLSTLFFENIQDKKILWKQSFNEFRGGGFAQPKLYAAFFKDPSIPVYVPHTSMRNPQLVYEAQSYEDSPFLCTYEQFLASMGFGSFNFVTILLYAGEGSHINPHRDREQILGFETSNDVIATFVYGAKRTLKVIYKVDDKEEIHDFKNDNNSLYIMKGLQKFTQHSKSASHGLSFSIIFRQLKPYNGKMSNMSNFNKIAHIDWPSGAIPRAWKSNPDPLENQLPGTFYPLRDFNQRRLHTVQQRAVLQKDGFASSIVLYSQYNVVSEHKDKIWFVGYPNNDDKLNPLNNSMLACAKVDRAIAVYQKVKKGREVLGNFIVNEAVELNNVMYFLLIKINKN